MSSLPPSGRIPCAVCHRGQSHDFDRAVTGEGDWRVTNNPLAWGSPHAEVVVLGFSKGPTQAGALATAPHAEIAYKGGRSNLAKILHHVRLIERPDARLIDQAISSSTGRFHFGSLVRCTVERRDPAKGWTGTGGGMLDRFVAEPFGKSVVKNCAEVHLGKLPSATKLVVMLGMGTKLGYVRAARNAIEGVRPGKWRTINDVAYADGAITVVHTEHFQSQGALIPNWLSETVHPRGRFGLLVRDAVRQAVG